MLNIIIPTYGKTTRLHQTLLALEKCYDIESASKIIVIENGVKHDAESICARHKHLPIKYIYQREQGLVNARNRGIEESLSEHLLFLDDDIELKEKAIQAYNNAIAKYGPNSYYSGPLLPKYESTPPEWLMEFLPWSAKNYTLGGEETKITHPGFLGGNMCIPRKGLIEAGRYEGAGAIGSNSGGVGEEARLQERLLALAYNAIWLPEAAGYHWIPSDRCDVNFAKQRAYRHGFTEAINDKSPYPKFLGAPRWVYRRLTGEYLSLIKKTITGGDLRSTTEQKIRIFKTKGMIEGYKQGR